MRHYVLRLDQMRFADYPWTERHIYWLNEDGSHHFDAARYQVQGLRNPVQLTGTRYRYHMRSPANLPRPVFLTLASSWGVWAKV